MKHFLHKISLFTTAAMLSLASFAQNVEYKGINYILDEESKTAAVTYQGTNPEENNYKGEITLPTKFKYNDVYYRVTSIGEKAFYGCDSIEYINIGGLIETIGSQAFGNSGMSSLIIPEDVKTIAKDAFKGSNISLFLLGTFSDYSFLNNVSTSTGVFAPEASLQTIMDAWPGIAKSIETPYYMEILSSMTTIAFRLHKTEYYSLPNAVPFEFSSVITQGVEIFADPETGIYSRTNLAPGTSLQFVINYSVNYEDCNEILNLKATQPTIECTEAVTGFTTFTATITAQEEETYIATEKGIVINNTKYKADDNGKVEASNLSEETEYTAKPYAIYKGKTYYGEEFTFTTSSSTGIANTTAGSEPKVTLVNNSRNGSLEISVSCEGEATYSIVNITGQKESEGILAGENKANSISTAELSSGIYLINVSGNKINKTLKFIIK